MHLLKTPVALMCTTNTSQRLSAIDFNDGCGMAAPPQDLEKPHKYLSFGMAYCVRTYAPVCVRGLISNVLE